MRSPVGTSPLLLPVLETKSGPQAARIWPVRIRNTGQSPVFNVQATQFTMTQTAGPTCTPTVQTATPIAYGNIAPGASVSRPFTINFTGCAVTVRFKLEMVIGAGPTSQQMVVANHQTM